MTGVEPSESFFIHMSTAGPWLLEIQTHWKLTTGASIHMWCFHVELTSLSMAFVFWKRVPQLKPLDNRCSKRTIEAKYPFLTLTCKSCNITSRTFYWCKAVTKDRQLRFKGNELDSHFWWGNGKVEWPTLLVSPGPRDLLWYNPVGFKKLRNPRKTRTVWFPYRKIIFKRALGRKYCCSKYSLHER